MSTMGIFKNAATFLNLDISYQYQNHDIINTYAYQSYRHGDSTSVSVPVVSRQLSFSDAVYIIIVL